MFGIGKLEELLVLFVIVGLLALTVAMGVKVLQNKKLSDVAKVLWVLALIFLYPVGAVGAAVYFFWAGSYRRRRSPQS